MLAIIPARGGSKGLPGKNIKNLCGKPLIQYTIDAALQSKSISQVVISTDSDEIAKVALECGAEVPFMRPESLATDTAKSVDAFKFTVEQLEKKDGQRIEDIIILQPTSPLRTSANIDEAVKLYKNSSADSVISFCKEQHSIFWHKYLSEEGLLVDIFEDNYSKNRQEIRTTYYPNGAIYILKTFLLNEDSFYTENTYPYLMDRLQSVDIDTMEDFLWAEFLLSKK